MDRSSVGDGTAKAWEDIANVRPLEFVRVVKAHLDALDEMLEVVKRIIDRHEFNMGLIHAVDIRQGLREGHQQVRQNLDLLERFFSQQPSSS